MKKKKKTKKIKAWSIFRSFAGLYTENPQWIELDKSQLKGWESAGKEYGGIKIIECEITLIYDTHETKTRR